MSNPRSSGSLRRDGGLLDRVLACLKVHEGPDQRGEYLCFCSFHDDQHRPNLHVSERGHHCFACGARGSLLELARHLSVETSRVPVQVETVYRYMDEAGKLLFEVVRFYGPNGKKSFYQRKPDGRGGFEKNLKGVRRVLYKLPELLARPDDTVHIVEGEKDVHTLMEKGFLATTNAGGAGKWRSEYSTYLKNRDVVLLGDNDDPGRKHIAKVEKALKGIAKSVKVVWLPDLPEQGDVTDWFERGGTPEKLSELIARVSKMKLPESESEEGFDIQDAAPENISRPLALVGDHGYAATWVYDQKGRRELVIVRDDGALFTNARIPSANTFEKLGLTVRLHECVPDSRTWSGAGLKRYLAGERPSPKATFQRVVKIVDHFMDFSRSLAPQEVMCELIACYTIGTYTLDAFHVVGYLWPNGNKGSGKTRLLEVVVELAYLGQLVLNASSLPTLRDLADYGATLAFDDAEGIMDVKRVDPDKRALFLAGNRKGSTISTKEQMGERWRIRHYRTYCPRLFSAIRLPDDVLASRTITIPLVVSPQKERTDRNPQDHSTWPHDRRRLVDDLWALGLHYLSSLRSHDGASAAKAGLSGRSLEPWRSILAVAHWLDSDPELEGLHGRIEELSRSYQTERHTLEKTDITRLAVQALADMALHKSASWVFRTKELTDRVNQLAIEMEIAPESSQGSPEKAYTTTTRIGKLLERLRFDRPEGRNASGREWKTDRSHVQLLCRSHGVPAPWIEAPSTKSESVRAPVAIAPQAQCPVTGVTGVTRVTGDGGVGDEGELNHGHVVRDGVRLVDDDERGHPTPVTPVSPVTPVTDCGVPCEILGPEAAAGVLEPGAARHGRAEERCLTVWLRKNAPAVAALWPEAPMDAPWIHWRRKVGAKHVSTLDEAWSAVTEQPRFEEENGVDEHVRGKDET